jgi:hypothetical protein
MPALYAGGAAGVEPVLLDFLVLRAATARSDALLVLADGRLVAAALVGGRADVPTCRPRTLPGARMVSDSSPGYGSRTWRQQDWMARLMCFPTALRRDPAVDAWFESRPGPLGALTRAWFERMRACGDDVRELLHDGQPTACVGDAAFAYVDTFTAHANVGFFVGPELPDPARLLQGTGRHMRHVKVRPEVDVDGAALSALIRAAYEVIRSEVRSCRA